MKIILVALIVAVASARRPPRGFDIDYSDSPPFFDSPPPSSSRLSYLRPYSSSSRHQFNPSRVLQSFSSDDRSIISDQPPSYRGEKIIYGPLPPSSYYPRRPHSFYKSGPSSFAQELSITQEYRGPPPPALPSSSDEDPRKQPSVTGDERPGTSSSSLLLQFPTTIADEQNSSHKSAEQPISLEIPTRQPLSFGGHSNHLSYGNHGLGFAWVAGATSAHLDPLAIAELQQATATTSSPSSPSGVQVSQQQAATNTPTPTETLTSAPPKFIPMATQPSTINTAISSSDSASKASSTASSTNTTTTTAAMTSSVTPKTHLDLAPNSPSQTTKALSMKLQETPRLSYEFRAVTQELPAASHGQLPLQSSRPELSHVLDIKQNLLHEENKANFPYQQFDYQFHQQNNNNAAPLRFTIPTTTISTSPLSASTSTTMVLPVKSITQGLSLAQTPLALAAVPNSNTYTLGQNQIDLSQIGKISSINFAPQLPSFYYAQNTDQMKTAPQISTNIPLASFYMLPNNVQNRQPVQINAGAQTGIPLQFNAFGGIELLTSSSNAEPVRSDILGLTRVGLLPGQLQVPESTFNRIGFGQNIWQS